MEPSWVQATSSGLAPEKFPKARGRREGDARSFFHSPQMEKYGPELLSMCAAKTRRRGLVSLALTADLLTWTGSAGARESGGGGVL